MGERHGPLLLQEMACSCSASNHNLKQRWPVVNSALKNKLMWNLDQSAILSYLFFFINVACEAPAIWFEFDMVQVPYYDAAGS